MQRDDGRKVLKKIYLLVLIITVWGCSTPSIETQELKGVWSYFNDQQGYTEVYCLDGRSFVYCLEPGFTENSFKCIYDGDSLWYVRYDTEDTILRAKLIGSDPDQIRATFSFEGQVDTIHLSLVDLDVDKRLDEMNQNEEEFFESFDKRRWDYLKNAFGIVRNADESAGFELEDEELIDSVRTQE